MADSLRRREAEPPSPALCQGGPGTSRVWGVGSLPGEPASPRPTAHCGPQEPPWKGNYARTSVRGFPLQAGPGSADTDLGVMGLSPLDGGQLGGVSLRAPSSWLLMQPGLKRGRCVETRAGNGTVGVDGPVPIGDISREGWAIAIPPKRLPQAETRPGPRLTRQVGLPRDMPSELCDGQFVWSLSVGVWVHLCARGSGLQLPRTMGTRPGDLLLPGDSACPVLG